MGVRDNLRRRDSRPHSESKGALREKTQQYISLLIVALALVAAFTAASGFLGINIAQIFTSQFAIAAGVIALGYLVVDRYRDIEKRLESTRERVNSVYDRLNDRINEIEDQSAGKVTGAVRSQVSALRDDIDALRRNHPWLTSVPDVGFLTDSRDLRVKLHEFFKLYSEGENSGALTLLYKLPKLGDGDRTVQLTATPTDVCKASNILLFPFEDIYQAGKIIQEYRGKFSNDSLYVSHQLRCMLRMHDYPKADRILQDIYDTYCPIEEQAPWYKRLWFLPKPLPLDGELNPDVFRDIDDWRYLIALSYYFFLRGDPEFSNELWNLGNQIDIGRSQEGERTVFAVETAMLMGRYQQVLEFDDQKISVIWRKTRIALLKTMAAAALGELSEVEKYKDQARKIPAVSPEVSFYIKYLSESYSERTED